MSSSLSDDSEDMQYSRDLLLDWMNDGTTPSSALDLTNDSLYASDVQLPTVTDAPLYADPLSPLADLPQWGLPTYTAPYSASSSDVLDQHDNSNCQPSKVDSTLPEAMQLEGVALAYAAKMRAAPVNALPTDGASNASPSSTGGSKSQRKTNRSSSGSSSSTHEEQSIQPRTKRSKVSSSTLAKLSSGLSVEALWEDIVSSTLLTCSIKRIADTESLMLAARGEEMRFIEQTFAFVSTALTPADSSTYINAMLSRPRIRHIVCTAGGNDAVQKLQSKVFNVRWEQSPDEPLPDAEDMPRLPMLKESNLSSHFDAEKNTVNICRQVLINRLIALYTYPTSYSVLICSM